jgi:hypothetical protein
MIDAGPSSVSYGITICGTISLIFQEANLIYFYVITMHFDAIFQVLDPPCQSVLTRVSNH